MQIVRESFTKNAWFELSTIEQLANIGGDVEMAIYWRGKGDQLQVNDQVDKVLELLELTIIDPKNVKRLREITAVKALVLDDFRGGNEYQSTDEAWHKYFAFFTHLVKTGQGKNYDTSNYATASKRTNT